MGEILLRESSPQGFYLSQACLRTGTHTTVAPLASHVVEGIYLHPVPASGLSTEDGGKSCRALLKFTAWRSCSREDCNHHKTRTLSSPPTYPLTRMLQRAYPCFAVNNAQLHFWSKLLGKNLLFNFLNSICTYI